VNTKKEIGNYSFFSRIEKYFEKKLGKKITWLIPRPNLGLDLN